MGWGCLPLPRGWGGGISPRTTHSVAKCSHSLFLGWLLPALMGHLQLSTGALGTAVAVTCSMCRATGNLPWAVPGMGASDTQGPKLLWHRVQGTEWCMCMPRWLHRQPHPGGHRGDQGNGDTARAGQQRDTAGHGPTTRHVSLQGTWCPEASGRGTRLAQPGPCACHRHGSLDQADAPGCSPPALAVPGGLSGVHRGEQGLQGALGTPNNTCMCVRVCARAYTRVPIPPSSTLVPLGGCWPARGDQVCWKDTETGMLSQR